MKTHRKNTVNLIGWMFCLIFLMTSTQALSEPFSTTAEFDSGWRTISQGESLVITHNLGDDPENYVVYMEFFDQTNENDVNQIFYGGADLGAKSSGGQAENQRRGAYWKNLNHASITVYRMPEDLYVEKVRIRIWKWDSPIYDSDWQSLTPGATAKILEHNKGWDPDSYVVYMDYKNTAQGINQCYYAGNDFGDLSEGGTRENERVGAYWRSLTNNTITLFRRAEDTFADNVRIRLWLRPVATYDSGWVAINQDQSLVFNHNVSGNPNDYIVDLQFKNVGDGINQQSYGGVDLGSSPGPALNEDDRMGAYWMSLNPSTITVYRQPEDIYAPEVRVRIFNIWTPPAPDYDSWWMAIDAGHYKTLDHNLGGVPENYYVDMIFKNLNGIHHRFYGGIDLGSNTFGNDYANHRMGAFWYDLTSSAIKIYRCPEDIVAPEIRVRIWKTPKPDYDSGWMDITAGAAKTTLNHQVRGSHMSYLLDMKFKEAGVYGINQAMYGGNDIGKQSNVGLNEDDRVGAYWRELNESNVSVFRREEDVFAPQIRVMIWRASKPNYQTALLSLPYGVYTCYHHLGGFPGKYLVNMIQHDTSSYYINHNVYGGMDLGAKSAVGGPLENDRVGAYWQNLSSSSIEVFRRSEDTIVDYMRLRVWKPKRTVTFDHIRRHILNLTPLTAPQIYEADINDDGRVDVADIIFFLLTEL